MQGALEEVAAGDRASHLQCIVNRRRGLHDNGDVLGCSLGVGDQLAGQTRAHLREGLGEFARIGSHAARAAREQQHRVIRRHAAIGVDSVE